MSVAKLKNGDWVMGEQTLTGSDEIYQSVVTRIKSFKDDWFLDREAEINWFNILSQKNNKEEITANIKRVVLQTEGVVKIDYIKLDNLVNRKATISIGYTDNQTLNQDLTVNIEI